MNWLQNACLSVSLSYLLGVMLPKVLSAQESHSEDGRPHQGGQLHPVAEKSDLLNQAETKRSGPDDLGQVQSLNSSARVFQDKGHYSQAEPVFLQALAICEGYEGPDQKLILVSTLNNLARLYYDQGRYREMEPSLQRALAIGQEALGTEHTESP